MGWSERQSPEGDAVFLDHVAWFVEDLDRAAAALARLGFIVGAENVHMNRSPDGSEVPSGTINRLVTPPWGYLEFLGARGDTPLTQQHRAGLDRYQGLHLMAFSSSDVPGEGPRLEEAGFKPDQPIDMRRKVEISGELHEARFSVLRQPPEIMPEGRIQWCAHHTPQYVWRDGMVDQPNGVDALTGALWVVDDLDATLDRYSRYLRKPAAKSRAGAARIELDRGAVLFATPDAAATIVPGLSAPTTPYGAAAFVRSQDLAATEAFLSKADVAITRQESRLIIGREDALGATLVVHGPDDSP